MCSTGLTYSDGTKGPPGSYKLLFVALNPSKPVLMPGPAGSHGPIVV